MDTSRIVKIKEAVKGNFNRSPDYYQSFEDRYRFFQQLNRDLVSCMNLPPFADILDIGCGTGASCSQILEDLPNCRLWGLDNSPAMLEIARSRFAHDDRIRFVEGDGAAPAYYFDFLFDAVIYSASIFLIPDYKESLRQSYSLLKPNGSVGITFMDGLYDPEGSLIFKLADKKAKLGVSLRKPVDLNEFKLFFASIFPRQRYWTRDFVLPESQLREFFTIPAMSAGLFPSLSYPERVKNVNYLFDNSPKTPALFRWVFVIGEKQPL